MNTFILDFETTGLNPYLNDVIEVAIKKYGEDGNYHQSLIKPKKCPKEVYIHLFPQTLLN